MLLSTGMVTSNTGVNRAMIEVPETGTYRSADGKQSRFYRAGAMVDQAEYELLQMGGETVIGEELDAKKEPAPRNKKEPNPANKSE